MGQEAAVGEDQLETVVKQPVFVESQDEPCQGLVRRFNILKLAIDVGYTAPVGKVL